MNKERYNQIIDEAYENYVKQNDDTVGRCDLWTLKKEEFINNCKIDSVFSEKWGLKIEERELDMFERWELANLTPNMSEIDYCNKLCDEHNVPTKIITVKYNNKTIESYE